MSWTLFQLACVAVLAFAYGWVLLRLPSRRARLDTVLVIALIVVSSWASEDTSIRRYEHYAYPDTWFAIIDKVPLLVVLIWPLVILTARRVIHELFPNLSPVRHALAVAAMVFIDSSLVETVAVATGLWGWKEGGYLGVPLIGLIGWAAYAFSVTLALDRFCPTLTPRPSGAPSSSDPSPTALSKRPWLARALVVLVALGLTHVLLVATWWAFFRHALRTELPAELAYGVLALSVAGTLWLRRRPHRISAEIAIPRIAATSVFIALLALYGRTPELFVHFLAVAIPYLGLLDWPSFRTLRARPRS